MPNSAPVNEKTHNPSYHIGRFGLAFQLAITDDPETTGKFHFGGYAGGQIVIPNGLTATTLTFYASAYPGGDLDAAYTDAEPPVAISRTVAANQSIPIPADLYGAYEIAIVSDQAGPETINVNLKA